MFLEVISGDEKNLGYRNFCNYSSGERDFIPKSLILWIRIGLGSLIRCQGPVHAQILAVDRKVPSLGTFQLQLNRSYCGREIVIEWIAGHSGFQQAADAISVYVMFAFLTISVCLLEVGCDMVLFGSAKFLLPSPPTCIGDMSRA